MRSPKDMRIIQIDITNACVHRCSNCTRFCGHHKTPYFMDWETFRRGVDSLKAFDRTVGIMGGEPTLHPQFERFVRYAVKQHPSKYKIPSLENPLTNFVSYVRDRNYFLDESLNQRNGLGLWTSLCKNYYDHFELIQDSFSYQCLNDHRNPSVHQPLLVTRKELGIPDDKWIELRDKCWFQNMWSASITPKGAFFCEVAGALDMLFDGPGGWPIEPGWWKREPKDFGDQLKWCEICGGAIMNSGRLSSEEIDDVSPLMYEKLKELESPKLRNGCVSVIDLKNPTCKGKEMSDTRNRYLTDYQQRLSQGNRVLNPKKIEALIILSPDMCLETLKKTVSKASELFDSVLITGYFDKAGLVKTDFSRPNVRVMPQKTESWGRILSHAIHSSSDWICLITPDLIIDNDSLILNLKKVILNPGVLYSLPTAQNAVLFSKNAFALKKAGYDGIFGCGGVPDFIGLWDKDKQLILDTDYYKITNPDVKSWDEYAQMIDIEDKTKVFKCLDKIHRDQIELQKSTSTTD
ncbi:MAG TPA: radical SAM protein [Ruminiclostridium sp.]|nr:radical SAM protein [Ruminiclostridium sp.]